MGLAINLFIPIGLKRLIARPIATLTIEAQEKREKKEKIFADL